MTQCHSMNQWHWMITWDIVAYSVIRLQGRDCRGFVRNGLEVIWNGLEVNSVRAGCSTGDRQHFNTTSQVEFTPPPAKLS